MSDTEKNLNFKPSTVFLDEKKPEYYRNMFLNNCKLGFRYCSKILTQLYNIEHTIDLIKELDLTSDPEYESILKDVSDIEEVLSSLNNNVCDLQKKYEDRSNEIKCKDFQKLIDENTKKILEIESKQYEETKTVQA